MEYVYSALLLHQAKKPITEENIKKVLEAVGITVDEAKVKALVASLEGVNIDEVIQQAALTVSAPKVEEEKKEEKKAKEESQKATEEAVLGLSALFG
ncbi:MAG: 50S ribosomal protein P1 [Candidatus Aenigmatarchaeota archaeon]